MSELTIRKILQGLRPGNLQSVGIMQVIPLLSDSEFSNYVSPVTSGQMATAGYGNMVYTNSSKDKTMIVPSHSTYIVNQAAQDHALPHAGIVKKSERKTYQTAACVQQTQGGYINPSADSKLDIMPFALREIALKLRNQQSYGKLWESIRSFNAKLDIASPGSHGHLEYFYKKFEKELNEFVAEFETVPKQVGAIVLINGFVVGVERTPSYEYWNSIWPSLIRGCYGSLVLQYQKDKFLSDQDIAKIRKPLNLAKITTLDDLEKELEKTEKNQYERVKEIVDSLIDTPFKSTTDETVEKMNRQNIDNDQFVGQIIVDTDIDKDAVVYASLITSDGWFKGRNYKKNTFNL